MRDFVRFPRLWLLPALMLFALACNLLAGPAPTAVPTTAALPLPTLPPTAAPVFAATPTAFALPTIPPSPTLPALPTAAEPTAPPTHTPPITDFDPTNPLSMVRNLLNALGNRDAARLIAMLGDGASYAAYIEGGQHKTTAEVYAEASAAFGSTTPTCTGFSDLDGGLQIWTSGWQNPWRMTEFCYDSCNPIDPPLENTHVGFFLYPQSSGEWQLTTIYLQPYDVKLWGEVYGANFTPCDLNLIQVRNNGVHLQAPTRFSCAGAPDTRLWVNGYATVGGNPPLPNRVRNGPSKSNQIVGQIDPGKGMFILAGPVCADNLVWWQVQSLDGKIKGWTGEGDFENYWLFPCASPESCNINSP